MDKDETISAMVDNLSGYVGIAAKTVELLKRQSAEIEQLKAENAALKFERDALADRCGGTIPVHCADCELWGTNGWSQNRVGYCEGDDRPHKATDFCSYGKRKGGQHG